ncbi:hypothetical protein Tco_0047106 [Tanacetum coccineum]
MIPGLWLSCLKHPPTAGYEDASLMPEINRGQNLELCRLLNLSNKQFLDMTKKILMPHPHISNIFATSQPVKFTERPTYGRFRHGWQLFWIKMPRDCPERIIESKSKVIGESCLIDKKKQSPATSPSKQRLGSCVTGAVVLIPIQTWSQPHWQSFIEIMEQSESLQPKRGNFYQAVQLTTPGSVQGQIYRLRLFQPPAYQVTSAYPCSSSLKFKVLSKEDLPSLVKAMSAVMRNMQHLRFKNMQNQLTNLTDIAFQIVTSNTALYFANPPISNTVD